MKVCFYAACRDVDIYKEIAENKQKLQRKINVPSILLVLQNYAFFHYSVFSDCILLCLQT